jgi:hypothetical protein
LANSNTIFQQKYDASPAQTFLMENFEKTRSFSHYFEDLLDTSFVDTTDYSKIINTGLSSLVDLLHPTKSKLHIYPNNNFGIDRPGGYSIPLQRPIDGPKMNSHWGDYRHAYFDHTGALQFQLPFSVDPIHDLCSGSQYCAPMRAIFAVKEAIQKANNEHLNKNRNFKINNFPPGAHSPYFCPACCGWDLLNFLLPQRGVIFILFIPDRNIYWYIRFRREYIL